MEDLKNIDKAQESPKFNVKRKIDLSIRKKFSIVKNWIFDKNNGLKEIRRK